MTEENKTKPEENDEVIDLKQAVKDGLKLLNDNRKLLLLASLILVASLGFYIRTRNLSLLDDHVLELDPWIFFRYAEYIVENNVLMANDTMRFYPDGFNTSTESILLPYLNAYVFKILHMIIPDLTLVQVVQLYPPFVTIFTILGLFLLGFKLFNWKVGLIAASLLTVSPGFLFRTVAGSADKDALSMTFFILGMAFYFAAIKEPKKKEFYIYSILSGLFTGLLGMMWGGFIFVVYSIAAFNLFKAITSSVTKRDLILQGIWLSLLTLSELFTNRYGVEFFAIIKQLPYELAVLAFTACLIEYYLPRILSKYKLKLPKTIPTGFVSFLLSIVIAVVVGSIILSPSYLIAMINAIIVRVSDPLAGGEAMGQSVSENQPPYINPDWMNHLGYYNIPSLNKYIIFPVMLGGIILGAVLLVHNTFSKIKIKNKKLIYILDAGFLFLLFTTLFSRYSAGDWLSSLLSAHILFGMSIFELSIPLFGLLLAFFLYTCLKENGIDAFKKIPSVNILFIAWFFLQLLGARGAIRLLFPFIPVAVIAIGYFIDSSAKFIKRLTRDPLYEFIPHIVIAIFVVLFANSVIQVAAGYGLSTKGEWGESYDWIRENTPEDAVFIHWWDYGYWIQSLGRRATLTDGGNPFPEKNYLMGRHLFCGYNISEVYDYLTNVSSPDYFYVVSDDVGKFYQMARIGERDVYYTTLVLQDQINNTLNLIDSAEFPTILVYGILNGGAFPVQEQFEFNNQIFTTEDTYIVNILLPLNKENQFGIPFALIYNTEFGQSLIPISGMCAPNADCEETYENGIPGYFEIMANGGIWIPEKAKDMFMTQAYLLNNTIPGFELVWESGSTLYDVATILGPAENIRIYKLNYTLMEEAIKREEVWG